MRTNLQIHTWKEIVCKFYLTNLQILPLIYQNFDFVQNHLIIYFKSKCAISLNEINHSCSWNIKFTRNKYETMLPFRSEVTIYYLCSFRINLEKNLNCYSDFLIMPLVNKHDAFYSIR